MLIQTDEEGKKLIQSLCGVAVESIGARILPLVSHILTHTKDIPPQVKDPDDAADDENTPNPAEAQQ